MKKIKILVSFLIVCFFLPMTVFAYTPHYSVQGKQLQAMGLMAPGELRLADRLTRPEGAVLLVRLLGQAEEALAQYESGAITHPFGDVPQWASPYVAWLYANKYTSGTSPTTFGTGNMESYEFCAFVLRALHYKDFNYKESLAYAQGVGLLTPEQSATLKDFYRDGAVLLCFNALSVKQNGTNQTLAEHLGLVTKTGTDIGQRAPEFEVTMLYGGKKALADLRGRPVLINFWASWSAPCAAEMKDLQKIYKQYEADVAFVFVAYDDKEPVEKFLKEGRYNLPVAMDSEGRLSQAYGINAFPTTFVLDASGVITEKMVGARSEADFEEAIQSVIN